MVTEKDIELLDSYLSNRLDEAARADFESRLASDQALKREHSLQRGVIEGIKQARAAELKAMLNQTVIPPATSGSVVAKVSLWVAGLAVAGAGAYFLYLQKDTSLPQDTTTEQASPVSPVAPVPQNDDTITNPVDESVAENETSSAMSPATPKDVAVTSTQPKAQTQSAQQPATESVSSPATSRVKQPTLNLYDPTQEENTHHDKPAPVEENHTTVKAAKSSLPVEVDNSNKKYQFHYQFKDGKLFLYGSFKEDLYEILEFFNNNKRTVFLYYNANYFLLDEAQAKPTPLKAITDTALLKRLREYRQQQ